jgi:hypothetical protein
MDGSTAERRLAGGEKEAVSTHDPVCKNEAIF